VVQWQVIRIGAYGLEVDKSAEIQDKLFKASQMTGEAYGNISNAMSGAITNVATLGVSFDSFLGSVIGVYKKASKAAGKVGNVIVSLTTAQRNI